MIFLLKVLCCFIIYRIVYYLNNEKNWGSVKASSFIALIIGTIYEILIHYNFHLEILKHYILIMMGATFMGMISKEHGHKYIDCLISSFIFCVLYQNISPIFNGLGGLLGTIACISVLCIFGIERLINIKKEPL